VDHLDDPLQRLIAESRPPAVQVLRRTAHWFWKLTLASAAVWFIAWPLVAYHFHVFSPVTVLLTPLLWIPVTLLLYCGFVVFTFGWVLPPAARICGCVCDGALRFLNNSVHTAREVPGGHFWVPGPPLWWMLVFYGGLLLLVFCPALRPPRRWCWAALAGWLLLGFVFPWLQGFTSRGRTDRLICTFVSVGHGTSVVLELPGGQTVLYDAGGLGSPRAAAQSISAVLWARGICHLDAVVLSHADTDHYNAMSRLVDRFSMGAVYVPPTMFSEDSPALRSLRRTVAQADVPLRKISAGDGLPTASSVRLAVLHPPAQGDAGSDNANSIVLLIEIGGRRILLPGDLEGQGTQTLVRRTPVDCDLVMAPHHGRPTVKIEQLLRWSAPEWIVVSGRADDEPAHHDKQLAGFAGRVLHTATSGAVIVETDGHDFYAQGWR
jgi:competence protein ComEC